MQVTLIFFSGNCCISKNGIDIIKILIDKEERKMKKIIALFAVLLLCLSTSVFADEHTDKAILHADSAVTHGKAGHAQILVDHAKKALDHTLAASLVAKSVPKGHLDAAAKSLQDAIDHGNLGHADMATKSAQEAVAHLKAAY
jgi:hypothetical protein